MGFYYKNFFVSIVVCAIAFGGFFSAVYSFERHKEEVKAKAEEAEYVPEKQYQPEEVSRIHETVIKTQQGLLVADPAVVPPTAVITAPVVSVPDQKTVKMAAAMAGVVIPPLELTAIPEVPLINENLIASAIANVRVPAESISLGTSSVTQPTPVTPSVSAVVAPVSSSQTPTPSISSITIATIAPISIPKISVPTVSAITPIFIPTPTPAPIVTTPTPTPTPAPIVVTTPTSKPAPTPKTKVS